MVLLRAKIPTAACGGNREDFGAAVCKTQGPPKGRSGCRAPQEGADAAARNRKRTSLMQNHFICIYYYF